MLGKFEPVLNATILSAGATAIITCLVAFNVPITNDQRGALLGLVGVIIAIFFGGGVIARSNVVPVAKVERIQAEAAEKVALAQSRYYPVPANPTSPQQVEQAFRAGGGTF